MDILDRAYVKTSGRLHCHKKLRVFVNLSCNNRLLLVTAGHTPHNGHRSLTASHIILLDQLLRISAHLARLDKARAFKLRLPVALQHEILLQRVVQYQSVLMPVFRNMAHTVLGTIPDRGVCDILSQEFHSAFSDLLQSGQPLHQLCLAVAVDTGNADDLARADIERHMIDGVALVQVRQDAQILHMQDLLAGVGRRLVDDELHGAANHHVRQLLLVRVAGVDRADALALAQDGYAVGHGHDLIELVRDEEDGLALARKLLHRGHELVDLLRGEHGGRLVEDEDLVVAVEHLEDLDALLHADGDVLDLGIEVDLQAVFFREFLDLFARFLALNEAELRRLRAEDDVVEHGEHVDELEVLVHHADAERGGIIGVVDLDGLAVFADLARLRLVQAEEHAHERGFAGAVFTEQGVDLALFELQGDVVVGLDIDFGSYPFVTSSNTVCAGACTGLGVAPNRIGEVYGIFKAYCTRVGAGPFPSELFDETGDKMCTLGHEFGSVTGRKRRCGWIDLVALKYSVMINGVTKLIMMKSDVLDTFETIKACVAYKVNGEEIDYFPYDITEGVEPVYAELPGWQTDMTKMQSEDEFPEEFNAYLTFLEEQLGVEIKIVSVGPDRAQTIERYTEE